MDTFRVLIENPKPGDKPTQQSDPDLQSKFLELQAFVTTTLDAMKAEVKQVSVKLSEHEIQIDALEQYSRRNCLLVHGASEASNEDVYAVVTDIFRKNLDMHITRDDIDRCHRLGPMSGRDSATKRPIIIKFLAYQTREVAWKRKKALKESGLLLTESLTRVRHSLLVATQKIVGPRRCWTQDGTIIAIQGEKRCRINSSGDLAQLAGA